MSRERMLGMAVVLGLAAGGVPYAAAQDNAPPVIDNVWWTSSGGCGAGATIFDPNVECAEELQQLTLCVEVTDADLADPDTQEVMRVAVTSTWVPFVFNNIRYGPEPPSVTTDDPDFGYIANTVVDVDTRRAAITFRVPHFNGVNQARLRGLVRYDVFWSVLVEVTDSTAEDPRADGQAVIVDDVLDMCAVQNTVLRPGNPPPFADAGPDQSVEVGSAVTLDGSRTFDGSNVGIDAGDSNVFERDFLQYTWEWISGPVRVDPVDDNDGNSATVKVTLDRVGTYVYRLLVSDGVNPVPSSDSVTINVVSLVPENRAPRAVIAGPANTVVVGSIIQLNGTGSTDPDGDQLTFRWQQTNELGGQLSPDEVKQSFQALKGVTSPIVTWQATTTGTFHFRLLVTDPGGLSDTQLTSVEVVESAATAKTAGDVAAESAGATPETTSASDTGSTPTTTKGCGGGLLPLAVLPCLLWLIRGRLR